MNPSGSDDLEWAIEAVRDASKVCLAVARSSDLGKLDKSDKSPVTIADFASQAVVARSLSCHMKRLALVAEEGSAELRVESNAAILDRIADAIGETTEATLELIDIGTGSPAESFWVLDPIDGTKGFLRGEQYAVALAKIEGGVPVIGVLGCPSLSLDAAAPGSGAVLWARRAGGVFQSALDVSTGTPVGVSKTETTSDLRICESVESGHSRHDVSRELRESLEIRATAVRIDSQAKYAAVARGNADVYWRLPTRPGYEEKIWDHAAGALIVGEAGGRVTDIDGRPLDFSLGKTLRSNRGVVASHGRCHERVLEAIAPHFSR